MKLEIDPVPTYETPIHYKHPDAEQWSRLEAVTLVSQIRRTVKVPDDVMFRIRLVPHDFGSYREVVISVPDHISLDEFDPEDCIPVRWDDISKDILTKSGHPNYRSNNE